VLLNRHMQWRRKRGKEIVEEEELKFLNLDRQFQ